MQEKESPKNIVVRMPNWLGDLVMATPILSDLHSAFPTAKITAMCQGKVGDLLLHDPNVDEIFSFTRPSGWIHRIHSKNILNPLIHSNFDLGILLTNSLSSAWWFWRGGVQNRIGFKGNLRGLFLSTAVIRPLKSAPTHQVQDYKSLLLPLGIPVSTTQPKLYLSEEEIAQAKKDLHHLGVPATAKLIGINPGAAYGSAKCWPPERFRAVIEKLISDKNTYILLFGDNSQAGLVHEISKNLGPQVIDLASKTTLRQLMSFINLCHVILTNDSGPMHIASALQRPLVAIFGSTSEVKTGPYYRETVIHKHPSCSPCFLRTCPIDFRCMKEISVDEIYQAILNTPSNQHVIF